LVADAAGREFAKGEHTRFIGIRIKADPRRGHRTLELFLNAAGEPPENFVVTLPKINGPAEVEAFQRAFPALRIEVMAETPGAIRTIREIVSVAGDRLAAVHFGPFDFIASCGVPGPFQRLSHPLCDWARHTLVAALADTGIPLSDGPTAILPVGTAEEIAHAQRLHADNIRRALECGIYQGWDLHPAQLTVRYAALYSFFRENLPAQRARLENYLDRQAQSTRVGAVFDDAATARGLFLFFERGRDCGAIDEQEAPVTSPSVNSVSQ
jgi:citrate lyase beta subunit